MDEMNKKTVMHEDEIDLLELAGVLFSHIRLLVTLMLLGGLIAGGITKFLMTPVYSSTSMLYIISSSTSITSLADIQVGSSLTKDYEELILSRPIVDQVIEDLNLNRTYNQVVTQTTVTNPSNTRIIKIKIEDEDPQLAKDIADAFAKVSMEKMSEIMRVDAANIAQYGYVATIPDGPSLTKNTAIGAMLGLFLAAAFVVIAFLIDDTVSTPEDVEKYLSLNTLASIPMSEEEEKTAKNGKKKKKLIKGVI